MKALKWMAAAGGLLVVLLAGVGVLLPNAYRVERSVLIQARPEAVFPLVDDLKRWPEWTAWTTNRYPDMRMIFEGPASGVGSVYRWEGKSSGTGKLKLTQSETNHGVWYDLDFENGRYVSQGSILLTPSGDSTHVTWVNGGELGRNPINRWFGLFMDAMMGPDFTRGLENLKAKVERDARK